MDELESGGVSAGTAIESADTSATEVDTGNDGYDVESASADLASDLFPNSASDDKGEDSTDTAAEDKPEPDAEPVLSTRSAPKSWAKEMHESYLKLDPSIQDYIDQREESMHRGIEQYKEFNEFGRQMNQAIAPYRDLIQREGIDAPRAVQALMNAHKILRESAPAQKTEYFMRLAKDYGVSLDGNQEVEQIDPTVKALMDKVSNLEGSLNQRQQAERDAAYKSVTSEVEAFAADKAHPYFDEVSDDIVMLLKTGIDLKEAYEKAVWANPVTRQKEISRIQTEQEKSIREKAIATAEAKKKAASTTIRNRDTQRTPTEAKRATMRNLDDALRETQREINSRH